jgi:hypothetical protein
VEKLIRLNNAVQRLNILSSIAFSFEKRNVKSKAVALNLDQLSKGKSNEGERLRTYKSRPPNVYADRTIGYKIRVGQPYNKVTLRDKGDFYRSFKIIPFHDLAVIWTDSKKINERGKVEYIEDNIDVSGEALGINKENMPKLKHELIPEMLRDMRKHLQI